MQQPTAPARQPPLAAPNVIVEERAVSSPDWDASNSSTHTGLAGTKNLLVEVSNVQNKIQQLRKKPEGTLQSSGKVLYTTALLLAARLSMQSILHTKRLLCYYRMHKISSQAVFQPYVWQVHQPKIKVVTVN